MENNRIKNLKKELLSDNWYRLDKASFDYRRSNGDWEHQEREVYDRGNGASILLYDTEQKTIILTRQLRIPTYFNENENGMMIEVPAGVIDDEDIEACIKREVLEETGYRVKSVRKVMQAYMSPGACTELMHLFVATYNPTMKVAEGGGLISETEELEVLEISFKQGLEMMKNGEIQDAKTMMLLQYAQINTLL